MVQKSDHFMSHQQPLSLPSNRTGQHIVACSASGSAFNSDRIQQVDSSRAPAELSGSAEAQSSASSLGSQDSDAAPVQFEIHRIAGDGSCLFRAIAQGAHHVSTGPGPAAFYCSREDNNRASTSAPLWQHNVCQSSSACMPVLQTCRHLLQHSGGEVVTVLFNSNKVCPVGTLLSRRELFEAGFDLRREVCAEMVRRREDIEPFIPGVFDAYVSNMSLEGIWGGNSIMCLWERASP